MARRPKKSEVVEADVPKVIGAMAPSEDGYDEDENGLQNDSEAQHSGCGGALFSERVKQGLSTKDVAKQLRLSGVQIDALEQDDYASLPEPTIVKGFIRNYAKLLKTSPEPLLSAYLLMVPVNKDYSFKLKPSINIKITESGKPHKLRYLLITLALLSVASIWFFYQNYVQKPSPINPMAEVVEALPELALPISERIKDTSPTQLEMPGRNRAAANELDAQGLNVVNGIVSEKITDTALISEKSLAPKGVVKPKTIAPKIVVQEAVSKDVAASLGKTRLIFTATQETWVSVVNTSGKEVFNKILYAGNREVVDVKSPSEIIVGNAQGATLSVSGKVVDLAPHTRVNVARLRINHLR